MANDFRNIQVQIYSYQDKFRALPGDDKAAVGHVGATTNGDGNGVIDGAWSDDEATSEAFNVWQHLRLAQLATGTTDTDLDTYAPTNAEGGPLGIQSNPNKTIDGLSGSYAICSGAILGKFAKQLDATLDDGNTATGSMMAASEVNGTAGATPVQMSSSGEGEDEVSGVDDSEKYVVCMAF